MSKILFLVNSPLVVYNFRVELVERLLSEGHEVVISSPVGDRTEDLRAMGCDMRDMEMSRHGTNPFKDIKIIKAYKKLIKDVRPDFVLTYTIKPNIYGGMACRTLKVPYIVNITGLGTAVENGGFIQKLTCMMYKYALKRVQRVFFQNTENMEFFKSKKLALGKHALLPGSGVNLSRFAAMEYPSDETVEFVYMARIMHEKGIDQYLDAAKYIRAKYPNTVFHVCGFCEQAYEETLKVLHVNGTIVYHGMLKDTREILCRTHCTILPSYYPEGLSNTLLESAACARPIITTNRAGCREAIDDGVTGYIVNQKDSQDLIEKIEKFIALPREEKIAMGLAGRAKVEREFDRNIIVNAYMEEMGNEKVTVKV